MAYGELNVILLREGLDMFRQLLARLIPKRRRFRRLAIQATATSTHEPRCDALLAEVYHTHAAIHGANKLLPGDAFPDPPERSRTSDTSSTSKLA
jgi:hypothetical protein